jgi:hypothetical protein
MTKLRVNSFSISLDGYGAGPRQDLEDPLGVGGEALHEWAPSLLERFDGRSAAAGRSMEGLVGSQPALPCPGVRPDPRLARVAGDAARL